MVGAFAAGLVGVAYGMAAGLAFAVVSGRGRWLLAASLVLYLAGVLLPALSHLWG